MWSSWIALAVLASSTVLAWPLDQSFAELGSLQRRGVAQPQPSWPLAELQENGEYLQTPEASDACLEKNLRTPTTLSFRDIALLCRKRHGSRPQMSEELREEMQERANQRAKEWMGPLPPGGLTPKRAEAIKGALDDQDRDLEALYGVRPTRDHRGLVVSGKRVSASASSFASISWPSVNKMATSVATGVRGLAATPNNFKVQINPLQLLGSVKVPTGGVRPMIKMPLVV